MRGIGIGWVIAIVSLRAAESTADPAEPAPGAETSNKHEDDKAESTNTAQATRPQPVAVRHGTLGLLAPSTTEGFQAAVASQQLGPDSGVDAFTKVGGLRITPDFTVDILGEIHKQDLPRQLLDGSRLTKMFTADINAIGVRVGFFRRNIMYRRDSDQDRAKLNALKPEDLARLSGCNSGTDATVLKEASKLTDADICDKAQGFRIAAGARFLVRSTAEGDKGSSSQGIGWEVMAGGDFQAETVGGSGFVGLSGTHFNQTTDLVGSQMASFPRLNEVRFTAGFSVSGDRVTIGDTDVAPTAGVYTAISKNYWRDQYDDPGSKIRGWQVEGGVYASGHFLGGFHGMIEFSILRPYGHFDSYDFIINIIPSVGGSVTDKSAKKGT